MWREIKIKANVRIYKNIVFDTLVWNSTKEITLSTGFHWFLFTRSCGFMPIVLLCFFWLSQVKKGLISVVNSSVKILGFWRTWWNGFSFMYKLNIWKPSALKCANTLREFAWNCKNCTGLFRFHLLLSSKFTGKWKTIQKMDVNWFFRNFLWSIP